ncbi:protein NATD1 isoform X2 [Ictalurus furcatus]|uniref:protein NATD1 isoform X2 n=1 Tax=Ictalurus furcatus TaxID=66913 RepID=UPI00235102FA|nr:protein NATD1 isoform X2 [Ictalurus furcatus]
MGLHTMFCRGARALTKIKLSMSPFCVLSSEPYRVIHDRKQRRFTIRLDDGGKVQSAVLKYSYRSDGHLHLLSTQVPESFRGKGVAASLAKWQGVMYIRQQLNSHFSKLMCWKQETWGSVSGHAALDFVVEERLKASISCWYIKKYIQENPHHGYQVHIED